MSKITACLRIGFTPLIDACKAGTVRTTRRTRELLGDMLLELGQAAEARREYEATLKKEPNRFRAVSGAARAAAAAGDRAAARRYDAQLLTICERGDRPGRPELVAARQTTGRR
jgi:hypothetical protein